MKRAYITLLLVLLGIYSSAQSIPFRPFSHTPAVNNTVSVLVTNTITSSNGVAAVTNLGTATAVVLRFTIPRGADGAAGSGGGSFFTSSGGHVYYNGGAGSSQGWVADGQHVYLQP